MAHVPVTINGVAFPKDKKNPPFPVTIVGYAWITGLSVGGGPIVPPDEVPPVEPPLVIWGGPFDPPHVEHPIVLPDPPVPPENPPEGPPPKPHEGWNFNNGSNPEYPNVGWYYVYIPPPGTATPKRPR